MGIAVRGEDLENTVVNRQQRHVKRTTAQVKDQNIFFTTLFIKSIGNRRRRGFIDDAFHVQPRNRTRIFGRLALGIVEIRRNRNHGIVNLLVQITLRRRTHLLQNHR